MTDKKRTSMWVSPETARQLDKLEKKYKESKSFIIARAVKHLYEGKNQKKRIILTRIKR